MVYWWPCLIPERLMENCLWMMGCLWVGPHKMYMFIGNLWMCIYVDTWFFSLLHNPDRHHIDEILLNMA